MIGALLLAGLTMTTIPDPIDPAIEVMVVNETWDPAVCEPMGMLVVMLTAATGDPQLSLDMLVAWGVEEYEDGYGQNLTEPGEDALINLLEDCLT